MGEGDCDTDLASTYICCACFTARSDLGLEESGVETGSDQNRVGRVDKAKANTTSLFQ